MRIIDPSLTPNQRRAIEEAIRSPADKPFGLKSYATADLPSASSYPWHLVYDETDDQVKVSDGTDWQAVTASGLGTMATQDADAVTITGGGAQFTSPSSLTGSTTANATFTITYTGSPGTGPTPRVQLLTAAVPTAANQRIGTFNFAGWTAADTVTAACSIIAKSLNAWSSTDSGSYYQLNATPAGSTTPQEAAAVYPTYFQLPAANHYKVGTNQVVASRKTGWAAATGTATRTTFATGSVTTAQLAERVKALIDDLTSHGLIGA